MIGSPACINPLDSLKSAPRGAFTLIEISIVLVILGLLVSGVFVGRDMIQAANVRATLSTKGEFDVAVATFLNRYNYLPGDTRRPELFGGAARARTDARGDGDWFVEGQTDAWVAGNGVSRNRSQCYEALLFWGDLHDAGMLNKTSGVATDACLPVQMTPENGLAAYLPSSNWGEGVFWMLARNGPTEPTHHHYLLVAVNFIRTNGAINVTNHAAIPVAAAYNIDLKLDNGMPNSGNVRTGQLLNPGAAGSSYNTWDTDAGACSVSADPTRYRLSGGTGCTMAIQSQF
jgi:prepilin-type N-terminal cleavage/methylation domain-containing protein